MGDKLIRRSRTVGGKVWKRFARYYNKLFRNRNYVFIHRGPFQAPQTDFCEFRSYATYEEIPQEILYAMELHSGAESLETDRREIEQSAVLWVAICDTQPAGVLFTRRGRDFKRWFVPLEREDIVIFRMKTFPEFRGKGIAPALMSFAMRESLNPPDCAYIDCNIFNTPSIRSIAKVGFSQIATMKPISRKQALG